MTLANFFALFKSTEKEELPEATYLDALKSIREYRMSKEK